VGLSQLVPVLLRVTGLVQADSAVLLLSVSGVVFGVGVSFALIGFQSMMADAADEHEHLFGARREGLYFAGISLAAKASSGIGALIAGVVLDLIGFPHGLDAQGLAKVVSISPTAVNSLGIAYGPGAAVVTGIGMIILLAYRRGRSDHEDVRASLDRRREEAGASI
jgi:GPH family glycoside/pentoside/hexuronide:cation symporter